MGLLEKNFFQCRPNLKESVRINYFRKRKVEGIKKYEKIKKQRIGPTGYRRF